MPYYAVQYDLNNADIADYKELWDECERMKAAKYQESAYFFDYAGTARDLRKHLKDFIHENDLMMIVSFTERPFYTRAKNPGHEWIVSRFD